MNHKNIDHLLRKGPMKCPGCNSSMENNGRHHDVFECNQCNVCIIYDSINILKRTFSENGSISYHYRIEYWFNNDTDNITIFTNYEIGKSNMWFECGKSGSIILDTCFDSSSMTFQEIFNYGKEMISKFNKLIIFS